MTAPDAPRRSFLRVPVTLLVVILILAVAAPSLAISALLLLQSDNVNRVAMTNRAAQGVDTVAETLDREFRNMSTNLALLAASGWVETQDYNLLHERATKALAGTDTYLLAVDGEHHMLLNTRVPYGTPLPDIPAGADIDGAISRGAPTVSNIFFGNIAKREVFNVTMPLISGEFRAKALILTRNAESLRGIFKDKLPPPGWTYAILDGVGAHVIGDVPPSGPPDLLKQLCSDDKIGLHEQHVGDVLYSAASKKMDVWGWRACVWTSSLQADASISQRWRIFTLLTIIVVSLTILAGAALGRMLAGAIRRAATVGRALDAGGAIPETHSIVREVDDVIGTLTRAATRRLQHENEQALLLRETAHRAKNQIAIASALARLSARSAQSVEQLRDDIMARLTALGRSIDVMSSSALGAVPLKELISTQLQPFAADQPGRLELEGGDILVSPATAQSLGLVLHEMATNAAKYGAWSAPEGKVIITWAMQPASGLVIVWTETGGPPSKAPDRTGFGSSLIEMMIERNLGGTVERSYAPTGLIATFRLKPETVLS
ncbi:MAG TPA: sensor histidine kinase [Hyphomonadaceae bacterium]|nr:sensor histidine kinase [Hyphomonadaceae bacterium]